MDSTDRFGPVGDEVGKSTLFILPRARGEDLPRHPRRGEAMPQMPWIPGFGRVEPGRAGVDDLDISVMPKAARAIQREAASSAARSAPVSGRHRPSSRGAR